MIPTGSREFAEDPAETDGFDLTALLGRHVPVTEISLAAHRASDRRELPGRSGAGCISRGDAVAAPLRARIAVGCRRLGPVQKHRPPNGLRPNTGSRSLPRGTEPKIWGPHPPLHLRRSCPPSSHDLLTHVRCARRIKWALTPGCTGVTRFPSPRIGSALIDTSINSGILALRVSFRGHGRRYFFDRRVGAGRAFLC